MHGQKNIKKKHGRFEVLIATLFRGIRGRRGCLTLKMKEANLPVGKGLTSRRNESPTQKRRRTE